jgi:hypothetical protein
MVMEFCARNVFMSILGINRKTKPMAPTKINGIIDIDTQLKPAASSTAPARIG